ncbi:UV DNA damage repair endonuclease UvsE [Natronospora cellulosivora (SeqCode)]
MDLDKIDLGYACISAIIKDCSTAKTVPLGTFKKIEDKEGRIYRLETVARANLKNTIRLLWHNIAENINLYRFSSQLIPLGNHPLGEIFDYENILNEELKKIGRIIKNNNLKVSTHPGQYTVINTNNEDTFQNSIRDLEYHDKVLTAMGLDENAVMVTHVGGVYGDKKKALRRFLENFKLVPESVQNRLVIENDDSSYSIGDVLELCQEIKRPMVLDVHHHNCYNQGENLREYLDRIFSTWDKLERPPKIHFSSPRTNKNPKRHSDYINADDFKKFLELTEEYTFDIMIEAKKQDAAVLKLIEELQITKSL